MEKISFINYKDKHFEANIKLNKDSNELLIMLKGEMGPAQFTDEINSYFMNIHEKIIKSNIEKVNVDFTELYLMVSNSLRIFLDWFKTLIKTEKEHQYQIRLTYDNDIDWQSMMLPTIEKILQQSNLVY